MSNVDNFAATQVSLVGQLLASFCVSGILYLING